MNSANSEVNINIIKIAQMGALLLKKKYLDVKENFEKIQNTKLEFIIQSVQNSISLDKKPIFLKRCCDILVKIYSFIVISISIQESKRSTSFNYPDFGFI
jgi:hypothetical protein